MNVVTQYEDHEHAMELANAPWADIDERAEGVSHENRLLWEVANQMGLADAYTDDSSVDEHVLRAMGPDLASDRVTAFINDLPSIDAAFAKYLRARGFKVVR